MTTNNAPKVYEAIARVIAAMSKEGIGKDRTADTGKTKYKFRGIDDVYNALAPHLAANKLLMLPRMTARTVVERTSSTGNALFYTTVTGEFDFVSAEDGSKHTVGPMYGEAMDSGDKGTNKAMSAAFKYCAMQAFCIPTEGDNDTENQTHEVKPAVDPRAIQDAAAFRAALKAEEVGTTEEEYEQAKALRVYEVHLTVNADQERYKEAWKLLEAPERKAIKAYIDMVKDKRKAA